MDLAHGRRFWRPRRLRAPVGWPTAWVTWTWSFGPSTRDGALDPDEAAIDASNTTTNFIVDCRLSTALMDDHKKASVCKDTSS